MDVVEVEEGNVPVLGDQNNLVEGHTDYSLVVVRSCLVEDHNLDRIDLVVVREDSSHQILEEDSLEVDMEIHHGLEEGQVGQEEEGELFA